MLSKERHSIILNEVNAKKSVTIGELCELLDASESTIRRDLKALADEGLLVRVHVGAIALSASYSFVEYDVEDDGEELMLLEPGEGKLFGKGIDARSEGGVMVADEMDFLFGEVVL